MKKIVLGILMFVSIHTLGQNLVKYLPGQSQGYLILNELADIKYWHINLIERVYSTDTTFSEAIIERDDLIGKNYIRIPNQYITDSIYRLEIIA